MCTWQDDMHRPVLILDHTFDPSVITAPTLVFQSDEEKDDEEYGDDEKEESSRVRFHPTHQHQQAHSDGLAHRRGRSTSSLEERKKKRRAAKREVTTTQSCSPPPPPVTSRVSHSSRSGAVEGCYCHDGQLAFDSARVRVVCTNCLSQEQQLTDKDAWEEESWNESLSPPRQRIYQESSAILSLENAIPGVMANIDHAVCETHRHT